MVTMNNISLTRGRSGWLLVGVLLIAMNLRAPFTSMAPLLDELKTVFAFNAGQAGLLITLPLLAFSAVSPFAAGVARRWGLERTLFLALVLIGAGVLLRSTGTVVALFAGTVIVGAAIALGNVLLPSLLKRDFPDKVAPLTSLYVLTMGVAAAASSALVVPLSLASHADWRFVSRMTLGLTVLAALAWLPQLRRRQAALVAADAVQAVATSAPSPAATAARAGSLARTEVGAGAATAIWREPLAWLVTGYLGLDCFLYYVGVSWLPAILHDAAGYTHEQAASLHGLLLLATAIPGLVLIPLAPRLRDQRVLACLIALCMSVGLAGFAIAPDYAVVWLLFFGFGAGGGLILALALISLRTSSAQGAAALSGMAQCVGYFIAAAGPPLIGSAHELFAGWRQPLLFCAALGILMSIIGLYAGRNRQIGRLPIADIDSQALAA